jgi:hypothetical protein
LGWKPVKVFDGVGTGCRAVTAANTSIIDLSYQSFLIDIGRIDWAYFGAGRVIAMHARPWKKPGFNMGILSLNIRYQFDPVNRSAFCCLLWSDDGNIIFRLAGDHTSLTGSAFI